MYLCSDGHEEVCFEGRDCPVCEAMEELEATQKELSDLTDSLANLEKDRSFLDNQVYELEQTIKALEEERL